MSVPKLVSENLRLQSDRNRNTDLFVLTHTSYNLVATPKKQSFAPFWRSQFPKFLTSKHWYNVILTCLLCVVSAGVDFATIHTKHTTTFECYCRRKQEFQFRIECQRDIVTFISSKHLQMPKKWTNQCRQLRLNSLQHRAFAYTQHLRAASACSCGKVPFRRLCATENLEFR